MDISKFIGCKFEKNRKSYLRIFCRFFAGFPWKSWCKFPTLFNKQIGAVTPENSQGLFHNKEKEFSKHSKMYLNVFTFELKFKSSLKLRELSYKKMFAD